MSRGAPHLITTERTGADVREQLAGPQSWLYSSFADGFVGGNPAGVVVSPVPLSDAVAQAIAAVLSVPTTGFLVAPEPGANEVAVRFFTPEREIDACGHVTIAVAAALVEQLIWSWGDDVIIRALGGDFPLRLRDGATEMTHQLRLLEPTLVGWEDVAAAFGPLARHLSLPLAVAGTGLRHLIVPSGSVGLPYRLISDPDPALAAVLGLPSFTASGRTFYRRLALVAGSGVIVEVFDPVATPTENAAEIIAWLASRADEGTTP